ncbi:MAG TPA: TfoX/Sxy family protein [Thermoplasmata archaeon]|nr:TfoX/Sxy family protein [Thermoplasmata archaeon]
MKIPKAASPTVKLFEELTPAEKAVEAKKLFGQPAAFVNGNLFLGVFGEKLFVRLSEADRTEARRLPGCVNFEPMPGRPMSEYMVLPKSVLEVRTQARSWVTRSLRYASGLPPKRPKGRAK